MENKQDNRNKASKCIKQEQLFQLRLKLAEEGNSDAQKYLGHCYRNGIGTTKDEEKAFQWYLKSAEGGNSSGQYNLGHCYENGIGTIKDEEKAFQWYLKSAEEEDSDGQNSLGECYYHEIGTIKDEEKAFQWCKKSAEGGNTTGQYNIAHCYENGIGTIKDEEKAFQWYSKSAEGGNSSGQNNLGYCYKYGIGTIKDEEKAFQWFSKSAEGGDSNEQNNLGYCYQHEIGTTKDEEKAFNWYLKSAEGGNIVGQNSLGICYNNGIGTTKNEEKALQWVLKSAEGGDEFNQGSVEYYYRNEIGISKIKKNENKLMQDICCICWKDNDCNETCIKYYQNFSRCHDCGNLNIQKNVCSNCKLIEVRYLSKWTSGNYEVDKIICMSQLDENAKEWEIWKWIDYSKFKNIEYLAEGGFDSVWKTEWINMPEELFGFYNSNQVALKKLKNSQQISSEFLKEKNENKLMQDICCICWKDNDCNETCIKYYQNFSRCHDCGNLNIQKNVCSNCKLIEVRYLSKWTSGNYEVDKIICMSQLDENAKEWEIWKWIDYSKFKNIEYLAEGGFDSVWKTEWINMPEELFGFYNSNQVALKKLKNSQQISSEFLKELIVNFHCRDKYVVPILGITQDPKTKEYALVLRYMKDGNLKNFLQQNKALPWKERLWLLNSFIRGLKTIHSKGFIHRDLHPGNLMITETHDNLKFIRLGDLGLCRPVNEILSSGTYGVLPYIAPEVMNINQYTQASDIYSVGIIMWVISTGKIPFEGELYDPELAIAIFNGYRPKVHKGTPQCYVELMEKCWHNNPTKRPSAETIYYTLDELVGDLIYNLKTENALAFLKADQEMQNIDSESLYNETIYSKTHLISQPLMKHSFAIHESISKFDINKYIDKINLDD
ncbi:hypothetical protein Glove_63g55 [Diversispora epigaea]|uniref:Protein kinase domain-containing protein n=1 Tax=Diversispora epigaea TaxID=1348612 RepID=A0A397JKE2_9GLOM|nr:hypothetical protein Glove_63g55 [Diversispora epigaea]